jgi:glyoxylase-like metal-dependent hydrolase (beta-lactamase superfamily II)
MKTRTKRVLLGLGVLLLLIVAVPVSIIISAFAGNTPIPDGMQVTPSARIIKDGFVDVTMIDLGNGSVALVDAGNDPSAKAIVAELQRRGLAPDAVSAILITHGHGDHTAGVKAFPRAEVYALKAEVPLVEGIARPKGFVGKLMPLKPTGIRVAHPLKDGDTFILGDRHVTVFSTPGHTAGSAVYLVDQVLYFGDSAGAHKDGKLYPAVGAFSEDAEQNKASLRALAERLRPNAAAVQSLVFAHTGPMTGLQPLLDFAAR